MKQLCVILSVLLLLSACAQTAPNLAGETTLPIETPPRSTAAAGETPPPETTAPSETDNPPESTGNTADPDPVQKEEPTMRLKINDTVLRVLWEENESVAALEELVREQPLVVAMSPYGGFEQVGSLGRSLPRADVQTVTEPGDVMLYSGSQIVVFHGSNSWGYTRLGRILDLGPTELRDLLGNGPVTLTLSWE